MIGTSYQKESELHARLARKLEKRRAIEWDSFTYIIKLRVLGRLATLILSIAARF